jgi:alkylation response protein AidB-like acyl-CoA dehydrogenase
MDLRDSSEQARFRQEIRGWLRENIPPEWRDPEFRAGLSLEQRVRFAMRWQNTLYHGGWAGVNWPREYGGRELGALESVIFREEYLAADAPSLIDQGVGPGLVGPTIIGCGSDWQKRRFLPAILQGQEVWCQGFSEPNAGSDLASLRCRGELRGDEIVVTGQKIWTTYARFADWCILIVRTDPSAPKHRGLTFLLVDMKSSGIEVRPLREITGVLWFNEVFFDGVRVPLENAVGQVHDGWSVVMHTLSFERGGTAYHPELEVALARLVALARRTPASAAAADGPGAASGSALRDPLVRQQLAQFAAEIASLRMSAYRNASRTQATGQPGPEGSILKLAWSELAQRMAAAASDIAGPAALVGAHDPLALDAGHWVHELMWTRAFTIFAGTSEIQRNILAQRVLQLPRA